MRTKLTWMVLALGASALWGAEAKPQKWDFEDSEVGKLPTGWTAAKTGEGEGSVWKIVEDKMAPGGTHALAQLAKGQGPLFNLCVAEEAKLQDLEFSVALKPVAGKIDQGGGVVWRYSDANNYYVVRFNPLENNYRLFKVVEGKRTQLATKDGLEVPAGKWHTLLVRMKGDAIECSFDGKKYLEAKDATFVKAGKIGLWTKADAQTYFDKIEVTAIK